MTSLELIGAVVAGRLRRDLGKIRDGEAGEASSVAPYTLHKLSGAQVAAICRAILADAELCPYVTLRIPHDLVAGEKVPPHALTHENAATARNQSCDTPILVIATTVDDLGDTLRNLTRIGAADIGDEVALWAALARRGLPLPDAQEEVWATALAALRGTGDFSLSAFSEYVVSTRERIAAGRPLTDALGWALNELQVPRHSGLFLSIKEQDHRKPAKWQKLYQQVFAQRRPLLRKQASGRSVIDEDSLRAQFERVRDGIPEAVHPAIEAFLSAPQGWNPEAAALAAAEWEAEGVLLLFENAKPEKENLGTLTRDLFEYSMPDRLTDEEKDYLEALTKRRSFTEPHEEDVDFYEKHRTALTDNRRLKAKWDRFIYGKGVEHTDFQVGLLLAMEKLFDQASDLHGARQLTIRTSKKTPKDWGEINTDLLRNFALRYQGLVALTSAFVTWDTHWLFKPDELAELVAKQKKGKNSKKTRKAKNTSVSRAATQIKFEIELVVGKGPSAHKVATQLVWIGRPLAIGAELPRDLDRLLKRPLVRTSVEQRTVSRKGHLQSVALDDVGSLEAAFGRDAGSLVAAATAQADLARPWVAALRGAAASGRISDAGVAAIRKAWRRFSELYETALTDWKTRGLHATSVLEQVAAYGELLEMLASHARGDLNRKELWEPLLRIGTTKVVGPRPVAIAAPWHPLRLAGMAVKMRSLAGLIEHLLTAEEVNFGDARLFFADLSAEFMHPFYPEVVVGFDGDLPILLSATETLNDYSLAERPVHDVVSSETNEDPKESARQVHGLVRRFLDLQPHEHANLSVALYNCDSTALPLATVEALSVFQEEDEVRCNVVLRHNDTPKLARIYSQMLESVDANPDALVASETSRDFMAKLRIGIMLDPREAALGPNGKSIDVAFLQDVVSRRAQVEWIRVPEGPPVDLLEHVPARWAYKRSAVEDQLKSTAYLACPRQPAPGWAYLSAVYGVVTHNDPPADQRVLPARQIVFQDAAVHHLFGEVHGLAEWVVNYDDLLDKRQLQNQGISVIRYQRQRNQGRNLIVSSTSPLRTLRVLVKRRLEELDLGLPEERVNALAERMISDASAVSGDIVLRAAKQGVFAGELVGIVLSKAIAAEELGGHASTAWFFLDDYASWLGEREQRIADLLALSPQEHGGKKVLRVMVTEAKYVHADSLAVERKSSQQQLEDTVQRIQNALFGAPGRLDRDLWLSRLSDLLLDNASMLPDEAPLFEQLRSSVRAGDIEIELKGYSHVFVSAPTDGGPSGSQTQIVRVKGCFQEVFSREQLRALVKAYEAGQPLLPIRGSLGEERPWDTQAWSRPAVPVPWVTRPEPGPLRPGSEGVESSPSAAPNPGSAAKNGGPAPDPEASADDDGSAPGAHQSSNDERSQEGSAAASGTSQGSTPATPEDAHPSTEVVLAGPAELGVGLRRLLGQRVESPHADSAERQWLANVTTQLRTALLGYNLAATVTGTRLTPNAALIRLQGSDRLTLDQIEKRRSVLLTTHALKIISLTAQPGEIVVAIARPEREVVSLWDVLRRRVVNRKAGGVNASFVVGIRELDGEILYLNLAEPFAGQPQHAPHTLIAGATGSGKSVLLQNLLLDICATNSPDLAHIYMIDPKMGVDYPAIRALPHLRHGIITEQETAQEVLGELLVEMDRRYRLFAARGANNLGRYNTMVDASERLPAIFAVHDEFAEWMMDEEYKDAVATTVARLGVKARAAGIYMIFAAQRPDNTVFPMQLRSNLGNRLVLRVEDAGTSEIALGGKGADQLLGRGHLVARLTNEHDLVYAQVPFLSDDDFADAAAALIEDAHA